jgi:hypothetical protein
VASGGVQADLRQCMIDLVIQAARGSGTTSRESFDCLLVKPMSASSSRRSLTESVCELSRSERATMNDQSKLRGDAQQHNGLQEMPILELYHDQPL